MKTPLLFLLSAATILAQGIPGPQFFQIKEYLQLTDAQYLDLLRANDELNRRLADATGRLFALQQEITAEGEKDAPDALAIGSRYVEISRSCRDLRSQYDAQVARNFATLTDAQKTRLKTLEDIAKQFGLVSEAQVFRLMGDIAAPPQPGAPAMVYRLGTSPAGPNFYLPGCPTR